MAVNVDSTRLLLREPRLLQTRALVAGEWVDADSGATYAVTNPATGELLAEVPRCGAAETRRAIEAGQVAFVSWRARPAKERAVIMRRWADLMLAHQEDLARILTAEQGKPLAESMGEIAYAAGDAGTTRQAADRLRAIADDFPSRGLAASATLAGARAALLKGDTSGAIQGYMDATAI